MPPLLYVQEVENLRPDVKIVAAVVRSPGAPRVEEGTMAQLLDEHPVYVVSRRPGIAPRSSRAVRVGRGRRPVARHSQILIP